MAYIITRLCRDCIDTACVAVCPVDCIDMLPVDKGISGWKWEKPNIDIIVTDKTTAENNKEHVA